MIENVNLQLMKCPKNWSRAKWKCLVTCLPLISPDSCSIQGLWATLFAWLISHQPAVLFSQNKPATSNQPAVLFSQNKPAPAISHQPTEQAVGRLQFFLKKCSIIGLVPHFTLFLVQFGLLNSRPLIAWALHMLNEFNMCLLSLQW
jgi:hypothetical protein